MEMRLSCELPLVATASSHAERPERSSPRIAGFAADWLIRAGFQMPLIGPRAAGKRLLKATKRECTEEEEEEEEAQPAAAAPCSSPFSLSVSKLHQSLRHVEPNLRHLVLVANTLRGFQEAMQPGPAPLLQAALGQEDPSEGSSMPSGLAEPSWRLLSPPGDLLLCDADSSAFPALGVGQPKEPPLSLLSPEAGWIPHACPSLELMSPGGYLLEDSLDGVWEDIGTSMFDCHLWLSTSLPNFKEAFCSPGDQVPDLADRLDCLVDVLVGVQEL